MNMSAYGLVVALCLSMVLASAGCIHVRLTETKHRTPSRDISSEDAAKDTSEERETRTDIHLELW